MTRHVHCLRLVQRPAPRADRAAGQAPHVLLGPVRRGGPTRATSAVLGRRLRGAVAHQGLVPDALQPDECGQAPQGRNELRPLREAVHEVDKSHRAVRGRVLRHELPRRLDDRPSEAAPTTTLPPTGRPSRAVREPGFARRVRRLRVVRRPDLLRLGLVPSVLLPAMQASRPPRPTHRSTRRVRHRTGRSPGDL